MTLNSVCCSFVVLGVCSAAPVPSDAQVEACMRPVAAQVPIWRSQGVTPGLVRQRLETAFASCLNPGTSGSWAAFTGAVNADLAAAALLFLDGKLTMPDYTAIINDRNRKYVRAQSDPVIRAALATGDADGDLVPDALDRCSGSQPLTPTGDNGCPIRSTPCSPLLTNCEAEHEVQRALGQLKIMYNKACDDAPRPSTPAPLAWGRGHQGTPASFGFNLLVTRVTNQPPNCEVFYEVEFRFTQGPAGAAPVRYANALFSERESITPDTKTVMLPLKLPAAGERAVLEGGFAKYLGVVWRVRAVNGSQGTSSWSGLKTGWAEGSGVGFPAP